MKKLFLFFMLFCGIFGCTKQELPRIQHSEFSRLPVWHEDYQTARSVSYNSGDPDDDELEGVQCPVPMEDRVRNYTGIQCVFSSIEMLGRWAEEEKLINPPITSRSNCKSYSGPNDAANKLRNIGVTFEQSYRSREKGLELIRRAMADGRACLFGVPGHAMVLCHFDEENNVVRWVDNSDRSLRMQKSTVDWFLRRWDSWVLVVYAEPDLFPAKAGRGGLANKIPIVDRNNPQGDYPPNYIPQPQKQPR